MSQSSFEILQCLGSGGFGEVYLARSPEHGEVALKVLHQGLDPRSQSVQRLRDEARLLRLLDHPSILSIHDLVLLENRVALVTEYIDGQDLENLLVAPRPIPMRAGIEALAQVASALHTAYITPGTKGSPLHLLHRDIKPGNIRVGRDGRVKLLDFGIAKATGVTREAQTKTSGLIGSFAYMAPERFDPKQTDGPAGDVCSLGCVLFEVLSGGEMLLGDYDIKDLFGLALIPAQREEALQQRFSTLSAPDEVLDLLGEMLAQSPGERPSTADLSERLMSAAGAVDGMSLRRWASTYAWPAVSTLPGGLTGFTLTGGSISTASSPSELSTSESEPPSASPLFSSPTLPTMVVPEPGPALPEPPPVKEPMVTAPIAISPADEAAPIVPPPPERRSRAWMVIAALLLVLLGGGVVVGSSVAGLGYLLTTPAGPTTVPIAPEPDLPPEPTPVAPGARPKPVPVPRPQPGPVPGPVPGPQPGVVPEPIEPEPSAPDAVPETVSVDRCGPVAELEVASAAGRLTPSQTSCLDDLMRDTALKQTERETVARLSLASEAQRCATSGSCANYERIQRYFFEDIDRSDPDMMAAWTDHLYRTAGSDLERLGEVDLWARRALERKSQWSGSTYRRRVKRLLEVRARAAYKAYLADSSAPRRDLAFQRSVEWAERLRQWNLPADEAMTLCESAVGSAERCGKRVTTEAATEDIRLLSVPIGADVKVDGRSVGKTVKVVTLTHGRHTIEMSYDDGASGSTEIRVGGGEAIQWSWRKSTDVWESVY